MKKFMVLLSLVILIAQMKVSFAVGFQMKNLPDPITFKKVVIPREVNGTAKEIEYTDCVETSFYRFLQVALMDPDHPEKVSLDRLNRLTDDSELKQFFENYPRIHPSSFYFNTEEGQKIRTELAILLARRGLIYNKLDQFEVRATLKNVIDLFSVFFNKIPLSSQLPITGSPQIYQQELDKIWRYFSYDGFQITGKIAEHRDDDLGDALIYRVTLIDLYFNSEYGYQWDIHEFLENHVRVTGHSEVYYRANPTR